MHGIAAKKLGANFSSRPQIGKLNALMCRQPAARYQDVGAGEAAALTQRHGRPLVQHVRRRQLAAAHAGVREQGADAAFDVDPAVGAGRAGQVRNLVQLFLALHQVQRQRFQALGAGLEVERHQRRHAALARVGHRLVEVDLFGVGVEDQLVVDGAVQRRMRLDAQPAAADQALQCRYLTHVGVSSQVSLLSRYCFSLCGAIPKSIRPRFASTSVSASTSRIVSSERTVSS
jgi:hypothetical protein